MDWRKIKAEYIAGNTSYRKLGDKYGCSKDVLAKRARDEGWVALKRQCAQKTATKIVEMESSKQAERFNRLLTVSDKVLAAVEQAVDKFDAQELVLDKSALKSLSGTIKDIKDIQSIKTDLDIEEQKARIAILKRQAEQSDGPSEITVTIAGGDPKWQE